MRMAYMGRKKNLIYVFADQWRYHAMGCAGEDHVSTPAMDEFAADSVFCDAALSSYPLCSPHRAALLTGKDPLSLGMWTNCKIGLNECVMLQPQERAISDVLYDEGYLTAYIGKWHLDGSERNFSAHPESGADYWDAFTPPGERRHHFQYWHSYGAMDNHTRPHYWEDSAEMLIYDEWSPKHETDMMIRYLESVKHEDKPIFAVLSWNPPHPPYDLIDPDCLELWREDGSFRPNVPEDWRKDSSYLKKRKEYFSAVAGLDREFGRLIGYLRENGFYDDSVIVLSADHGDMMGSHGLYGKNTWYEESVRIPLVIHDREIGQGRSHARIVSEDQAPTLLELLGVSIPDTMTGLSHASSLMSGEGKREYSYHMMIPGMPEIVMPYRDKGMDNRAFGWRAIRTDDSKYIIDNGTEPGAETRRMLYDLNEDPYEMNPRYLKASDPEALRFDDMIRNEKKTHNDIFLI